MTADNYYTLLPRLGYAIDAALEAWTSHTGTVVEQPTYESITSSNTKDISVKVQALTHVLETLPARHAALVRSYNDPELDLIELPEVCANLVEELQSPQQELELDQDFNKILASKRFAKSIATLEKELGDEEQWRSQELRRLKASHLCLMSVREDRELKQSDVAVLMDAMEEIGVPLIGFGADGKMTDGLEG